MLLTKQQSFSRAFMWVIHGMWRWQWKIGLEQWMQCNLTLTCCRQWDSNGIHPLLHSDQGCRSTQIQPSAPPMPTLIWQFRFPSLLNEINFYIIRSKSWWEKKKPQLLVLRPTRLATLLDEFQRCTTTWHCSWLSQAILSKIAGSVVATDGHTDLNNNNNTNNKNNTNNRNSNRPSIAKISWISHYS